MIIKVESELIDPNEFDKIDEFDMPIGRDYIMDINIDREWAMLRDYSKQNERNCDNVQHL